MVATCCVVRGPGSDFLAQPANRGLRARAEGEDVEIAASRYKFEPAQIEVVEGDQVRLVLHSADTTHGFAIPALK